MRRKKKQSESGLKLSWEEMSLVINVGQRVSKKSWLMEESL